MTDLELAKVIDAARDEVVVQRNAALAEVARLTKEAKNYADLVDQCDVLRAEVAALKERVAALTDAHKSHDRLHAMMCERCYVAAIAHRALYGERKP